MIISFQGKAPIVASSAFIVESAQVIGDVVVGDESSVWFNAVIRGDVNYIRIGKRTNIQDGCVLHVSRETYPLIIEDEITVPMMAVEYKNSVVGLAWNPLETSDGEVNLL